MALINCSGCGHQISSRAKLCPKCGCTFAGENRPDAAKPSVRDAGGGARVTGDAEPGGEAAPAPFAPEPVQPRGAGPVTALEKPKAPAPAECRESVEEWYYATAAGRSGPVTQEALHRLAADGQIGDQTPVWKSGMSDWVAMSRHQDAAPAPIPAIPAPICRGFTSKWHLWVLALAPAWGALLQIIATELWVSLTHKQLSYYSQLWWIIVLANLAAAALDFLNIKKSGEDVTMLDKGMFLLVPVYLFLRDSRLNARFLRFSTWTVSLLLSLSGNLYLNSLYARLLTR